MSQSRLRFFGKAPSQQVAHELLAKDLYVEIQDAIETTEETLQTQVEKWLKTDVNRNPELKELQEELKEMRSQADKKLNEQYTLPREVQQARNEAEATKVAAQEELDDMWERMEDAAAKALAAAELAAGRESGLQAALDEAKVEAEATKVAAQEELDDMRERMEDAAAKALAAAELAAGRESGLQAALDEAKVEAGQSRHALDKSAVIVERLTQRVAELSEMAQAFEDEQAKVKKLEQEAVVGAQDLAAAKANAAASSTFSKSALQRDNSSQRKLALALAEAKAAASNSRRELADAKAELSAVTQALEVSQAEVYVLMADSGLYDYDELQDLLNTNVAERVQRAEITLLQSEIQRLKADKVTAGDLYRNAKKKSSKKSSRS